MPARVPSSRLAAGTSAYGNGATTVTIRGSLATGNVAMGSAGGTTTVATANLILEAMNGYAQLGYPGEGHGDIVVRAKGDLSVLGGTGGSSQYAVIGHGDPRGHGDFGDVSGNIDITVGATTYFDDESWNSGAIAWIGNVAGSGGSQSGNVSLITGKILAHGDPDQTYGVPVMDTNNVISDIILADIRGGDFTLGLTNSGDFVLLDRPLIYDSPHALSFLAHYSGGGNFTIVNSIQNAGTGAVTIVNAWDPSVAPADVLTAVGYGGSIAGQVHVVASNTEVGGIPVNSGAGVVVGSKGGTTTLAGGSIFLEPNAGFTQLGYRGSGATGTIDIDANENFAPNTNTGVYDTGASGCAIGGVCLLPGGVAGAYAQIGHLGPSVSGTASGDININATSHVILFGGGATFLGNDPHDAAHEVPGTLANSYAMIGNGDGTATNIDTVGGNITINAKGTLFLDSSITASSQAWIGNRTATGGTMSGDVSIIARNLRAYGDPDQTQGVALTDTNNIISAILLADIAGGDFTLGLTNPGTFTQVDRPLIYASPYALTLFATSEIAVVDSVQNAGRGAITIVAGWDTGVVTPAQVSVAPASTITSLFTTTLGAYGQNGGRLTIGGLNAPGEVAVGSAGGTTTVLTQDLIIEADQGYAQLGFNGDARGDIIVRALGDVTLKGASGTGAYAQIGNGGGPTDPSKGGTVLATSDGIVFLAPGAFISANAGGDALVLAAQGGLDNSAGASVLDVSGGGRWLVFAPAPSANQPGALSASPFYNRAFDFSSSSYAPVTSAGNRFVYALAPVLTVTADGKTRTYGSTNPAFTATITGLAGVDTLDGAVSGAPSLSTSATTNSNVGGYPIVAGLGTLISDYNYGFQFGNGTLTVTAAPVIGQLTGIVSKIYNGTNLATLVPGNYTLSGAARGANVSLNDPLNGTYDDKNVGTGKLVTVRGLALVGADAGNYTLTSASASAAIGTITAATVTASLTGTVSKGFDGTVAATLTVANYAPLSGVIGEDNVGLNNPLGGTYHTSAVGTGKVVSVTGLALVGADSGNYVLASSTASAPIGKIIGAAPVDNGILVVLTQKPFVNTIAALAPPEAPAVAVQQSSDGGEDAVPTDAVAALLGQSLSGKQGSVPSRTVTLINGLLTQFMPATGAQTPQRVPPADEDYSSWGNTPFWQ
jgi:hypothetical protein